MTRLLVSGHLLEVQAEALVTWAVGVTLSPFEIIGGLYWSLYFGMPSRISKQLLAMLDVSMIRENLSVIDDRRLAGHLESILPPLVKFNECAGQLLQWERDQVPSRIRKAHVKVSHAQGPRRPPWAAEKQYQNILSFINDALLGYLDAVEQAIPTLHAMLPESADPSLATQIDRAFSQIPDLRLILNLGFEEAIRRKSLLDRSNQTVG